MGGGDFFFPEILGKFRDWKGRTLPEGVQGMESSELK